MLEHVVHILTIVLQKIKGIPAQCNQCTLMQTDTNEGRVCQRSRPWFSKRLFCLYEPWVKVWKNFDDFHILGPVRVTVQMFQYTARQVESVRLLALTLAENSMRTLIICYVSCIILYSLLSPASSVALHVMEWHVKADVSIHLPQITRTNSQL
jgi:hypothetical protein